MYATMDAPKEKGFAGASMYHTYMQCLEQSWNELATLATRAREQKNRVEYRGKRGVREVYRMFLSVKNKEILGIFAADVALQHLSDIAGEYSVQRSNRRIVTKCIYTSEAGPILRETDAVLLRQSKFVTPAHFPFEGDITIFDDSIAMTSYGGGGNVRMLVVTHAGMAHAFRTVFNTLWCEV